MRALIPIETLENRQLLATYGYESLLLYDKLGAKWTHNETYAYSGDFANDSGSGTSTVTVASKHYSYDGHSTHQVSTSSSALKSTSNTYTVTGGAYLERFKATVALGTASLNMSSTRIAPKVMTVGTLYTDTGTCTGTFNADFLGTTINGTITGKTDVSCKLYGTERVTVPAGTFNSAVKGRFRLTITGTLKLTYEGESLTVPLTVTIPRWFWAVPGRGAVKEQILDAKATLVYSGQTARETINGTMKLKSSVIPSAPPAPIAFSASSADDVLSLAAADVL